MRHRFIEEKYRFIIYTRFFIIFEAKTTLTVEPDKSLSVRGYLSDKKFKHVLPENIFESLLIWMGNTENREFNFLKNKSGRENQGENRT